MAISETIARAPIDDLYLDPRNPRLGRHMVDGNPTQDEILEWMMAEGALEELAVSFLESGFWTQEALVVVKEKLGRRLELTAVEGNRRLAALKMLRRAHAGGDVPARWRELVKGVAASKFRRLESIPYVLADTRREVQAYLGFRHVSGIKEWNPAEKAEFIARLIEDEQLTYEQVMRRIGSKTPTVRQNYIAYRLLLQMEQRDDEISISAVEDRFSVLYLSLRTAGVQDYLGIDINAAPSRARTPVPKAKLSKLSNFARWLFGDDKNPPIVSDSREVDRFGAVLNSAPAVEYLERSTQPVFATAFRIAGGDESETVNHVSRAADEVEEALGTAHHHKNSKSLRTATRRLATDVLQLLELFPTLKADLLGGAR